MVIVYLIMLAALIAISILDIKRRTISPKGFVVLLLGGIAAIMSDSKLSIVNGVLAMLIVYVVLWMVHKVSRGSLGLGDVRLCAAVSLYLGVEKAFGMLAFSMILCGISAAVLIAVNKEFRNKALPFAPFVTAGTLAVLLL